MLGFLKKKKDKQELKEYIQKLESDDCNIPIPPAVMFEPVRKAAAKEGISAKEYMQVHNVNSFGSPLDKLVDGDLPWGWHTHNKDFVDKIREEYGYFNNELYTAKQEGEPHAVRNAMKSLLQYMDDVQQLCDQKGECFAFWCSEYLIGEGKTRYSGQLADLEANMDAKIKEYNDRKEHERLMLEFSNSVTKEMLLEQIDLHEEILQTDLYKLYDHPCAKIVLKEMLYFMDAEGLIERTKSGRTYLLKIKK